jgi:hypothetical protein
MVFKLDHIFGNNGARPSLGGDGTTLDAALVAVSRAEAALTAARALARSAAKREGVAVRGLFEDSTFILRASGEKWADTARREGEKAMIAIFSRSVDTEAADETSPFHHLARRLKKISPQDWPEHVAKMRAVVAGDYAPELSSQNKGEAILAAGRRARMSGSDERPQPEGLAAKIVAAGKRARTPTGGHKDD